MGIWREIPNIRIFLQSTVRLTLKHIAFGFALFASSLMLQAQISADGDPLSYTNAPLNVDVPTIVLSAPNVSSLLLEDSNSDANGNLLRDAVALPLDADIENDGTWFVLPNGDRVWKMSIKVPDAYSLELYFDDFFMPPGGRLFVMNQDMTEHQGAFTSDNNKASSRFCIGMVRGEVVTIEYYEPLADAGLGRISLLDVGYRYRDIIGFNDNDNVGTSPCEVDVACSEGNGWTDEIKSVVRIRSRINGQLFWASGTVVNNSAQDCKPYVLTSMNTSLKDGFQSSDSDYDYYRFHFGNDALSCGGDVRDIDRSIVGSFNRGDSNDDGGESGSDFLLLEISTDIPHGYPVYYAGWNALDEVTSGGGVGIHYPYGDAKKISTYSIDPVTSGWEVIFTHWRVRWDITENGLGIMELGSTGAPLLDASGRVIGTYTGGSSNCDDETAPDFFGKMSWHWQENPNPPGEKLKSLLNPLGTAELSMDGSSNPCSVGSSLLEQELIGFSIYPNPSLGQVQIDLEKHLGNRCNIQVSSVLGGVVYEGVLPSSRAVNLSHLQEGIYTVTLLSDINSTSTKKLIITK